MGYAYLFINRVPITENDISSNKTSDEGVYTPWLPAIRFLLYQKKGLV